MGFSIRRGLCSAFIACATLAWVATAHAQDSIEPVSVPGDPEPVQSQPSELSFEGQVYTFDPVDQSAPAWSWLDIQMDGAQFLLMGEQHYVAGIARATQTAFERYVDDGFGTLILEASPFLGRQVRTEGPDAVLVPYPYELAFGVDGMVDLIEAAHATATDPTLSVYGIDQPVTAIHSFTELSEDLPGDHARRMARGLSLKAALQAGEYLRVDHRSDLVALRASAVDLDTLSTALIDELELSMEIYTTFRAAQRGEAPRGLSDAVRERFMGDQLDLMLAERGANALAIILMGGAHILRGIGPNGVETLGQHAAEIAHSNSSSSVHVSLRRSLAEQAFPPAALFEGREAILLDTQSFLAANAPDLIAQLDEGVRNDLQAFDAIIYLRNAPRESFAIMSAREAEFRQSVITTLVTGGIPAVLALVSVMAWLITLVRVGFKKPGSTIALARWSPLAVLSAGSSAVLVIQILALLSPGNPGAMASSDGLSGSLLATVGIGAAGLAVVSVFQRWFSIPVRIVYSASTLGLIALALWMRHWNLGGML